MPEIQPLITIVIPTYNNGHLIGRAIDSIIYQTYKNWELVIIDNFSTDNTRTLVEEYSKKNNIKFFQINNGGIIAKSRNFGIQKSLGDYVAFLDSDDWWLPEKLEKSIKFLLSGMDLVYHDLFLFGKNGKLGLFCEKAKTRKLRKPITRDLIFNGNAINNSSVVVRKSILDQVGLLSEETDLIAWEDFDYWIRISKVTENFKKIPDCLGFYWIGAGNVTNPERTLRIFEAIKVRYSSDFYSKFKMYGKYPSWIEYGILVAKIELKVLDLSALIKNLKFLTIPHKLKLILKWIFNELFL